MRHPESNNVVMLEALERRLLLDGTVDLAALFATYSDVLPDAVSLGIDYQSYDSSSILVQYASTDAPSGAASAAALGSGRSKLTAVNLAADVDVETALAYYRSDPNVVHAEPNYVVSLAAPVTPGDTLYTSLWGLNNTGQTGGTVDADIDAPEAWEITTGDSSVIVAVIDTGVDYTHPDLAANMWTNPLEFGGSAGVDDDGNGFVDDIYGWDFANDDSNPMDDHSHGTHVAGTIGAVGDNATGVTGVNWDVQIMALKFLDQNGDGLLGDAIDALEYALMMEGEGFNIVATSNSWGHDSSSQSLRDAIKDHRNAGIVFVAAAGNGGADVVGDDNDVTPYYPASDDLANIVSVAATDHNDNLASFSNYGATSVDLSAPGVSIRSTMNGGGYAYKQGTSMATPHVAGVVALLAGEYPGFTYSQLISKVLEGVDPIPAMQGKSVTGGRLNAFKGVATAVGGGIFSDVNNNATRDPGEPGLSGWTVYADLNTNGVLNVGEPSTTTDADGEYVLAVPGAGSYTITEVVEAGWTETFPLAGTYPVVLADAEYAAGYDFGNYNPAAPGDLIIDNDDGAGVTITGSWSPSSWAGSQYGANYLHDGNTGKGAKSVRYTPTLVAGDYDVYIWYADSAVYYAPNTPVDIIHSDGVGGTTTATVAIDQTTPGGQWELLGTYAFDAGTAGSLLIRTDGTTSHVVADAVKFTPSTTAPVEVILDNTSSSGVTVTGSWTTSSWAGSQYGANYLHDDNTDKGAKSVLYTPTLAAGTYDVYIWYPDSAVYYETSVPIDITYSDGAGGTTTTTVTVDQTTPGGEWELLGMFAFDAGAAGSVLIRTDGTTSHVVADAVKFTPVVGGTAPVALNDDYSVDKDVLLSVPAPGVLGNDSDPQTDPLTADLVDDVTNGALTLNADGSFTYMPVAAYTGEDTFTYRAFDGAEYSNTATVTLTVIDPAAVEVIIDNTDGSGVTITGAWSTSSWAGTQYGADYLHDGNTGKGSKSVRYTPTLVAGDYDVYIWYPDSVVYYASNAPVDIIHAGGTDTVAVDQTTPGGQWELLGTYAFDAGTAGSVLIRTGGTTSHVVADAVKFTPSTGGGPVEVTLDNTSGSGVTVTGSWVTSSWAGTQFGANYLHDGNTGKGTKSVRYTPTLVAGDYDVYIWYPDSAVYYAPNAPVDIIYSDGIGGTTTDTVAIDQTTPGGQWELLGTYAFDAGTAGSVLIRTDGTTSHVVADAVRFTPAIGPSGDAGSSTPATVGATVSGEIESVNDEDWFSFSAASGTPYAFETLAGGTLADTTLTLYGTDGTTQLVFDDDGGPGWLSKIEWTAPAAGTYYIAVEAYGTGTGTYELQITDATPIPGEIHGSKWDDLDNDGVWDVGEPGLEGWKIYLDTDESGDWNVGEPFELTDSSGAYSFTGLAAGSYLVGEVVEAGWAQTFPGAAGATAYTHDGLAGFGTGGVAVHTSAAKGSTAPDPAKGQLFDCLGGGFDEFVVGSTQWSQPGGPGTTVDVTYSYANLFDGNLGGGLSEAQLTAAMEEALALWASYAPFNFIEVVDSGPTPDDTYYSETGHPEIRIGHHYIDGGSGSNVLAHAYYPPPNGGGLAGDMHFDNSNTWATAPGGGAIDVLEVSVHELGHSLGLGHEPTPPGGNDAIMNPYYGSRFSGLGSAFLLPDDIAGIQAIYGSVPSGPLAGTWRVGVAEGEIVTDIDFGNYQNYAPDIASLSDAPDPVVLPDNQFTLTATGVTDANGAADLQSVSFYRETNGTPGLQLDPGGDTLLATDSSVVGGTATAVVSTTGLDAGTYTYYAQAQDSGGALSLDGTDAPFTTNTVEGVVTAVEVILDNGDAGVVVSGAWTTSSWAGSQYGANYLHDANTDKGSKSVRYTPTLVAGDYDVYIWYPDSAVWYATNTPVDIINSDGVGGTTTTTVSVDQTTPGGQWELLGTFAFDAGTAGGVLIRTDGTTSHVVVDAIKFTPV